MVKQLSKQFLFVSGLLLRLATTDGQSSISFVQPPPSATICTSSIPAPTNIVSDGHPDVVDIVSCYMPNANTQVWSIDKPNVSKSEVSYPEIVFKKGDAIGIAAGGGVQTGGHGLTWKRYVTPIKAWVSGSESHEDDQYFGTISIPGVIPSQKLSSAIKNGPFTVASDPGPDGFLRLGYADDHYEDNGYWGHDAGWYEQCWKMENAWVVIIIKHNCAGSNDPACSMPAPMDVVSNNLDPNGFELNPSWGWQKTAGISPRPPALFNFSFKDGLPEDNTSLGTHQKTTTDTYSACIKGGQWGSILGHINWFPVTYTGEVSWSDHSNPESEFGDDDYNFHLVTDNNAGYTTENSSSMQLEFKSAEVTDRAKSRWWKSFHQAVDHQGHDAVNSLLLDQKTMKPNKSVVIGLFGLDFEHSDGWTELHPVYVLAVRVKSDPNDDTWVFFARNWGNEGWCGRSNHLLPLSALSVILPPPSEGFTHPQELDGNNLTEVQFSDPGMSFSFVPNNDQSAGLLSFNLLPPEKSSLIDGEIHLKWQAPQVIPHVFSPLSSSTNELNFTSANINNSQLITITNPNDDPLQIGQLGIDGTNQDAFKLQSGLIKVLIGGGQQDPEGCSNTTLPRNGSCSFRVACVQAGSPTPKLLTANIHVPVTGHPDLIIPVQAQQYITMKPRPRN